MYEMAEWVDGEPLAEVTEPPYDLWWPLAAGTHTVWAEGVMGDGTAVVSEPITFEVVDGVVVEDGRIS